MVVLDKVELPISIRSDQKATTIFTILQSVVINLNNIIEGLLVVSM
jgi:hypothetical protein